MAEIKTRPATPEYRDNWEKIFGKRDEKKDEQPRIVRVAPLVVPSRFVRP